jgi:hypothetical protein
MHIFRDLPRCEGESIELPLIYVGLGKQHRIRIGITEGAAAVRQAYSRH